MQRPHKQSEKFNKRPQSTSSADNLSIQFDSICCGLFIQDSLPILLNEENMNKLRAGVNWVDEHLIRFYALC